MLSKATKVDGRLMFITAAFGVCVNIVMMLLFEHGHSHSHGGGHSHSHGHSHGGGGHEHSHGGGGHDHSHRGGRNDHSHGGGLHTHSHKGVSHEPSRRLLLRHEEGGGAHTHEGEASEQSHREGGVLHSHGSGESGHVHDGDQESGAGFTHSGGHQSREEETKHGSIKKSAAQREGSVVVTIDGGDKQSTGERGNKRKDGSHEYGGKGHVHTKHVHTEVVHVGGRHSRAEGVNGAPEISGAENGTEFEYETRLPVDELLHFSDAQSSDRRLVRRLSSHTNVHPSEQQNINIRGAYLHVLGDLVQSGGVMVAGLVIWFFPEWQIVDLFCTLLFSVLVLATTVNILRDILEVLLESTPRAINAEEVGGFSASVFRFSCGWLVLAP